MLLRAMSKFQDLVEKGLIKKLNKKDCSTSLSPSKMTELVQLFNKIFFLGAITKKVEFSWSRRKTVVLASLNPHQVSKASLSTKSICIQHVQVLAWEVHWPPLGSVQCCTRCYALS
jgi:hypothetical protein